MAEAAATANSDAAVEKSPDASYFAIRSTVRAAGSDDGIVLLDLASGKYYSLNPIGARVWQGLAARHSRAEILALLTALFDAPAAQIESDVDGILSKFTRLGLLAPSRQRPAASAAITPAVTGKHPAAFPALTAGPGQQHFDAPSPRFWFELWWFLRGLFALLYMDVLTRARQFPGVCQALLRARPKRPRQSSPRLRQIAAAVDRAASFYYRRRWCLQRSAACAYLLRRSGFPVELVLGVQVLPFIAHAWVEWQGEVINDDPRLTNTFAVLDRI